MASYFVRRGSEVRGPMSADSVRRKLSRGDLIDTDEVRVEGSAAWLALGSTAFVGSCRSNGEGVLSSQSVGKSSDESVETGSQLGVNKSSQTLLIAALAILLVLISTIPLMMWLFSAAPSFEEVVPSQATISDEGNLDSLDSLAIPFTPASKVFEKCRDSVVLVQSLDHHGSVIAIGTGFLVGDGSKVVTNFHVIDEAAAVRVVAGLKTFDVSGLVGHSVVQDLAILQCNGLVGDPLAIRRVGVPVVGDEVFAIGNPQGLSQTLSQGVVSAIRQAGEATRSSRPPQRLVRAQAEGLCWMISAELLASRPLW